MNTESLAAASSERAAARATFRTHYGLVFLFLISGAAALIYQVCWQRLLFQSVGVDIDSVTIIVSTFMLGLGVGALVGGEIVDRYPNASLKLFALIEIATAAFGVASPFLIRVVATAIINDSRIAIGTASFALLLIPTTLMGATLPILVAHVLRLYRNVGVSVGVLYFANTLGAALGAGLTGFVALYYLGLTSTIYCAAALNFLVSAAVLLRLRKENV